MTDRHRSAITGQFVTADHAKTNPDTTVSEARTRRPASDRAETRRPPMNPPIPRYRLILTITGNTLEEVECVLHAQVCGGFLLDSDGYRRDEWEVVGGRRTSRMEQVNPEQTPEDYARELGEWVKQRREERRANGINPEGVR